jgi:hypothetical protein
MSVWLDIQNKPSSNFRQLLQERIEKAYPGRKLNFEEYKRLAKVREAAEQGELDALIEQQAQFGRRETQKEQANERI